MKLIWQNPIRAAGAVVVLALVLAGCGGSEDDGSAADTPSKTPTEPSTISVRGAVEAPIDVQGVMKENHPTIGSTLCSADDGYDDIEPGAQVTVRDADGATVALGELMQGLLGGESGDMLLTAPCSFSFVVTGVPAGAGFYSVEVAHRGEVSYDEDALHDPIVLTVGD